MIVATLIKFHDHEERVKLVDTTLLDPGSPYEAAVRAGLEGPDEWVSLDGNMFNDSWGMGGQYLDGAAVQPPVVVEACRCLQVYFE